MAIDFGRTKRFFLKKEAAYGVAETLAAGNSMRFNNFGRGHQPKNRVNSPEKNASPGQFRRFDRKPATSGTGLVFNLQPSGTLNTLSENDPVFDCGFGTKTNVTLATTVASSPTAGGCTVASAGTLAVGDGVELEVTGQTGRFLRKLTGVAGAVLTWDPNLPAAQTVGDDVKGVVTYKMITAPPPSIDALQALASGKKEELLGWGIDTLQFAIDANNELVVTASGPAKTLRATTEAQAAPGSQTFVGTQNPPSGITDSYAMIDDTVYLIKSANIQLVNALSLRNTELGVLLATEQNRGGPRDVTVGINAWAEDEAPLKDKAEDGTQTSVLIQIGKTEGNAIGLYLPKADFGYPGWDDPDAETSWQFDGVGLESAQAANDEVTLMLG